MWAVHEHLTLIKFDPAAIADARSRWLEVAVAGQIPGGKTMHLEHTVRRHSARGELRRIGEMIGCFAAMILIGQRGGAPLEGALFSSL